MEAYVYNRNRQLTGVLEGIEYLKWTRKYSYAGSFTLKAVGTIENAALLQIGNYIKKSNDDEIGMIEHIEMTQTDKEMITASGRFATAILDRRIVLGTEALNGDIGLCVGQVVVNHLISPNDPARHINFVSFVSPSFGFPVHTQTSYKNVYEVVTELCDAADIGIKTIFAPETGALTITLYQGTITQSVFSRDYENIISQIYTNNIRDYRNAVVVAGEGEGEERALAQIVGAPGEERRELYVDARDLRSEDFDDYSAALTFRGQMKLAEHSHIQTLDAEINSLGNLKYKTDYDIGSVVAVQARRWGVSLQTRITEITESYDGSGMSLDLTFGRGMLTLSQLLKGVS